MARPNKFVSAITFYVFVTFAIIIGGRYFLSSLFPHRFGHRDFTPMEFSITKTWDGHDVDHTAVKIKLSAADVGNDIKMEVEAPFFNDPQNPGGQVGKSFQKLWDYEVVEAFFLNDKDQYLEVELSPHGQHLLLMLNGPRKLVKDMLPITYKSKIVDNKWYGTAWIHSDYFPKGVSKFNAYAIHGSDKNRIYEAMYPVPAGKFKEPDFHRLEYFHPLNMQTLMPVNYGDSYHSIHWDNVELK